MEIQKEGGELRSTLPDFSQTDTGLDLGGDTGFDIGPDIGGTDTTVPDVPEAPAVPAPPSPEDIAAAASQQLQSFGANLRSLFGGMGGNFAVAGSSPFAGAYQTPAFYGATPGVDQFTTLGATAGGSTVRERAAVQITNHYLTQPTDPHLWSQAMAREASHAF
jgi:hypothetical protein